MTAGEPGAAVPGGPEHAVAARGQRGLAATTVVVLIVLPLLVPEHLRLHPSWLAALVGGLLLFALLVAYRAQQNRVTSLVRRLAIGPTLVLIVGAAWMTVRLLSDLVRGRAVDGFGRRPAVHRGSHLGQQHRPA